MVVLYEDEALFTVNKPAGTLVIAGRGPAAKESTVLEQLSVKIAKRLFIVHRLDRDTSGVLIVAKTAAAHKELCALFESRKVRKIYLAIVEGVIERPGSIDQPLKEFGSGRVGVSVNGKPSKTSYRPLQRIGDRATLLELEPETGRRHQIRVHLYSAGHPVLGDPLYGKPSALSKSAPRLLLHAWKIEFPWKKTTVKVAAPLPPDFNAFLDLIKSGPSTNASA